MTVLKFPKTQPQESLKDSGNRLMRELADEIGIPPEKVEVYDLDDAQNFSQEKIARAPKQLRQKIAQARRNSFRKV